MRLYLAVFAESIYAPQGDENHAPLVAVQRVFRNQSMPRKGTKTRGISYVFYRDDQNQSMPRKGTETLSLFVFVVNINRINLCPVRGRKPSRIENNLML